MALRNIHNRITPLITKMKWKRQKFHSNLFKDYTSKSLLHFLRSGKEDIYRESDLQDLVSIALKKVETFRQFINRHEDGKTNFTLNLNYQSEWEIKKFKTCSVKKINKWKFKADNCLFTNVKSVKLNSADMASYKYAISGLKISLILAVAYKIDGVIKVREQAENLDLTPEQIVTRLKKLRNFGQVKNIKLLKTIPKTVCRSPVSS